jgi:DNA-binding LacI/PurR family transcriptional regulator
MPRRRLCRSRVIRLLHATTVAHRVHPAAASLLMPTIFDVAREAGVGIGTVSRVLNSSPLVSELTRQRVLAAMHRLQYRPNAAARAFGRRRTATLELIVPLYARAFFLDLLRGVQHALAATPYTLVVHTVGSPQERARVLNECCVRASADGALLVWLTPTEAFVERVVATGFPVVLLNAVDARLWSVAVDHASAAASAVRYCLGLGHRRIGLVDRPADPYDPASEGICRRGYQRALTAAGLPAVPAYQQLRELSAAGGATAVEALLNLPQPPTAVVAASEIQAVGILETARAHGWRVPADLSVVGYSDSELAEFLGLTTMQVPLQDLGHRATQLLLDVLTQPDAEPTTIYVPTQLLRRRTCSAPAVP